MLSVRPVSCQLFRYCFDQNRITLSPHWLISSFCFLQNRRNWSHGLCKCRSRISIRKSELSELIIFYPSFIDFLLLIDFTLSFYGWSIDLLILFIILFTNCCWICLQGLEGWSVRIVEEDGLVRGEGKVLRQSHLGEDSPDSPRHPASVRFDRGRGHWLRFQQYHHVTAYFSHDRRPGQWWEHARTVWICAPVVDYVDFELCLWF